jgi:hypothetical protein
VYSIRFLKCLFWAMPEQIHLVGHLLWAGLQQRDPFLWDRLVIDVPEMVPRHVQYWKRNYM